MRKNALPLILQFGVGVAAIAPCILGGCASSATTTDHAVAPFSVDGTVNVPEKISIDGAPSDTGTKCTVDDKYQKAAAGTQVLLIDPHNANVGLAQLGEPTSTPNSYDCVLAFHFSQVPGNADQNSVYSIQVGDPNESVGTVRFTRAQLTTPGAVVLTLGS